MTTISRRVRLAAALGLMPLPALLAPAPANAQFGGIVFDPRNYAQNILTAARTLQQINNQIQQLQNQAKSLVNQARNLASLPVSTLSTLQQQINRTRQLLAHVISSGIKLMTLAVITGIGTTLFRQFTSVSDALVPDIQQAMTIALAALTLLGLGIFGPGIANGIVTGGPQLGAGAAAGTALAAGATVAGGVAAVGLAGGAAAGAIGGAAMGGARLAGATSAAWQAGAAGKSGGSAIAGGLGGVAKRAGAASASPLRKAAASLRASFAAGRGGPAGGAAPAATSADAGPPAWAKSMKRRQTMTHGVSTAASTLKSGDSHGGGAGPDISEKE